MVAPVVRISYLCLVDDVSHRVSTPSLPNAICLDIAFYRWPGIHNDLNLCPLALRIRIRIRSSLSCSHKWITEYPCVRN